jgi:WD40 repeat protein/DNA-binding winged helix-turn-helix (wHTH) protein
MNTPNKPSYEFGPFRLYRMRRLLLKNGILRQIRPKVLDTLLVLIEGRDRVIEKSELLQKIWPDKYPDDINEDSLTRNISELRKTLEDPIRAHRYIVTIPGEGYQFVESVREFVDESDDWTREEFAHITQQSSTFDVFVSCNDEDRRAVQQIVDDLRGVGLKPRFDAANSRRENQHYDEISHDMRSSAACAIFAGPHGIDDWERREIAAAVDRAKRDSSFRLFLVLLPDVPTRFEESLPPFLRLLAWVDLRGGFHNTDSIRELIKAIEGEAAGPLDVLEGDNEVCPYQGLQTFDEQHAEFFFGRDGDLQRLIEKLRAVRFLAVVGPSGSGKSSLIRAGLMPALRKGSLPRSDTWIIFYLTPGAEPLTNLAANAIKLPQHIIGLSLSDQIYQMIIDERTLHNSSSLALAGFPQTFHLVWVIDQFEEVFTLCRDENERTQFIANLLYAASVPDGRDIVVLGMRADFYAKCASYPELSRFIASQQFLVSPMDAAGLRSAIEEPAWRVGLAFEDGLVERILRDIQKQPGALPWLEHTMLEIWNRRRHGLLTLSAYEDAGGVEGAIAKRADAIYLALSSEQQKIAQRIMLRLTQPGEGTEDTRRRAAMSELIRHPNENDAVEAVIHLMTDARLFTMNEQAGERWVEVSHEALIRGWPRLHVWVDEDRQALLVHRRLTEAAREWQRLNLNDEVLYDDVHLAEAMKWRPQHEEVMNELEKEFLNASQAARIRKYRRVRLRRRWARVLTLTVLITVGTLAFIAMHQAKLAAQRRDAVLSGFSLSLSANAISQLKTDMELSLLLAIEAVRIAHTMQAEEALRQSLLASRVRSAVREHTAQVVSASFSQDGKFIVTASVDKTARVWDVANEKTVAELRGHERRLNSAEFSPDGRFVVTSSEDKTARIWDARTGRPITILSGHTDSVNNAAFNFDGNLVITASSDNTARVWDVRSGQSLMVFPGHDKWLNSAVFSPDGRSIATASGDSTARIWDAKSGRPIKTLEHKASVLNVAFSPDGRFIATACRDHTARVWEVGTWRTVVELIGHTDNVNSAEFSPDGRWIVTASKDTTARVYDVSTGATVFELAGHKSSVNRAVFSPDGKTIATASGDMSVRIWETNIDQSTTQLRGHSDAIYGAAFSPDGKRIITASKDRTARVWDVTTGRTLMLLEGHRDSVQSAAFSPDGMWIATSSKDNTARIWEASTGKLVTELRGHEAIVHSVAFSPNGKLVVTASGDNTARVWEVSTGRNLVELRGHTAWVNTADFSPDGKFVVTSSRDNTAKIWDATTGELVTDLNVDTGYINSAQISPDGRFVLAACGDNIGRVWDLATRQIVARLHGHSSWINYAEFSPDGRFAVTASGDKTARLWDVRTGQTLLELRGHTASLMAATFSPDGQLIATASLDGTARIYACEVCGTIGELLTIARHRVTRTLTPEERAKYLDEPQSR